MFSEVSVIAVFFSEFDCGFCGVPALNHTLGPREIAIIIIYPVLAAWIE